MSTGSGTSFPWLRRIRVTFGGVTNTIYDCDGTQERIRATVKIHKVIQALPSATNIMLWNLSPNTRNSFQRGKTTIRIEAGWDQGPFSGLSQCFYGTFVTFSSLRAGPDIVTSINAISAVDDLTLTPVNKFWTPGRLVRSIALELAGMLPGVAIDDARIKGLDGIHIAAGGWNHTGTVFSALNALSSEFGFSWTVCDGYFQALKNEQSLGGNTTLRDPYLIDINPVFIGPGMLQMARGMRIRCAFNATVNPMFDVAVESKIEPRYNGGGYIVQTVDHDLGCFAGDHFMTTINAIMDPGKAAAVNGL